MEVLWIFGGAILVGVLIGVPFVLIRRHTWAKGESQEKVQALRKREEEKLPDHSRLVVVRTALSAGVLAGIALHVLCNPLLGSWQEVGLSLGPPASVLAGGVVFAGYSALKGGASAGRGLREMLFAFPFIALAMGSLLAFINEYADTSEAKLYATSVRELGGPRRQRAFFGERKVVVGFQSWQGVGTEEFRVSRAHGPIAIGDRWVIRVRAGALGYPWVEDMRPR